LIKIFGVNGVGKNAIAKQSIKYCTDRNYFKYGAYEIEAGLR
jgi:hypothetical protein